MIRAPPIEHNLTLPNLTYYLQPSACDLLPTTCYLQPTTYNLLATLREEDGQHVPSNLSDSIVYAPDIEWPDCLYAYIPNFLWIAPPLPVTGPAPTVSARCSQVWCVV